MAVSPVWTSRTGSGLDAGFAAFSDSTSEDAAFLPYDVQGSIAHVQGLAHAGLVESEEAAALVEGLEALLADFDAGTWSLDPALEDGHMNLEAALQDAVGAVAAKLHTGRSRNDQVATCIVLYARDHLLDIAQGALDVAAALSDQAQQHAATPWAATTHGQPAQPATLGFLLTAHAHRFQDLAKQALATADAVAESPLGAGAVAGSTLPLDPAFTAAQLGLRPPRNALLATGSRDALWHTLQVTTQAGLACAALADDLGGLFTQKAIGLPDGFTTGSSLMPHKRNPDALELVRGTGRALKAHEDAVHHVMAGLGLGYMRDLQVTKPHLVAACQESHQILSILQAVVGGLRVDPDILATSLDAPGVTATDAAEALVMQGVPFREAYKAIAQAYQAVEAGGSLQEALEAQGLPTDAVAAVAAVLTADPSRRNTLAGPAPDQVTHSVTILHEAHATLKAGIEAARAPAVQEVTA